MIPSHALENNAESAKRELAIATHILIAKQLYSSARPSTKLKMKDYEFLDTVKLTMPNYIVQLI